MWDAQTANRPLRKSELCVSSEHEALSSSISTGFSEWKRSSALEPRPSHQLEAGVRREVAHFPDSSVPGACCREHHFDASRTEDESGRCNGLFALDLFVLVSPEAYVMWLLANRQPIVS